MGEDGKAPPMPMLKNASSLALMSDVGGRDHAVYRRSQVFHFIAQYLRSTGKCQGTLLALEKELEENKLLPKVESWTGETRPGKLDDLMWRFGSNTLFVDTIVDSITQNAGKRPVLSPSDRRRLATELVQARNKQRELERKIDCMARKLSSSSSGAPAVAGSNATGDEGMSSQEDQLARRSESLLKSELAKVHVSASKLRKTLVQVQKYTTQQDILTKQHSMTRSSLFRNMKFLKKIQGHFAVVYCVCADPKGRFVYTGSDDWLIKVWSASTGDLVRTLRGHSNNVADLRLKHVQGRKTILASASDDRTVRLWEVPSGRALCVLKGHTRNIEAIRFDPYSGLLFSASNDGSLCVWDTDRIYDAAIVRGEATTEEDKRPIVFPHVTAKTGNPEEVNIVEAHPWGNVVATGDMKGMIRVWFVGPEFTDSVKKLCRNALVPAAPLVNGIYLSGDSRLMHCIQTNFTQITNLKWSNDGYRLMANCSEDGMVRVWEWKHTTRFAGLGVSNSFLFADPVLRFTLTTADEERNRRMSGAGAPLATSVSGRVAVASSPSRRVPTLDQLAWSCDDRLIITAQSLPLPPAQARNLRAFWDQQIRVWDANGFLLHTLRQHRQQCFVLTPHPTDPMICLSAGMDGQVIIWDIHNGRSVSENLALSPNGIAFLHEAAFLPEAKSGADVVCADSMGRINFLGTGLGREYLAAPPQQFFGSDKSPLTYDENGNAIDSNQQLPPHLCPPTPLCDSTGVAYQYQPKKSSFKDRAHATFELEKVNKEKERAALNEVRAIIDFQNEDIRRNAEEVRLRNEARASARAQPRRKAPAAVAAAPSSSPGGGQMAPGAPRVRYRDDLEEEENARRRAQGLPPLPLTVPGDRNVGAPQRASVDDDNYIVEDDGDLEADRKEEERIYRERHKVAEELGPSAARGSFDNNDGSSNNNKADSLVNKFIGQAQDIADVANRRRGLPITASTSSSSSSSSAGGGRRRGAARRADDKMKSVAAILNDQNGKIMTTTPARPAAVPKGYSPGDEPHELASRVEMKYLELSNGFDRQWLSQDARVPQLGEFLVYCPQAHCLQVENQFALRCGLAFTQLRDLPPLFLSWMHTEYKRPDWPVALVQVKDIKYHMPFKKNSLRVDRGNGDELSFDAYHKVNNAIVTELTVQVVRAPPTAPPPGSGGDWTGAIPRTDQWEQVQPGQPLYLSVLLTPPEQGSPDVFISPPTFNAYRAGDFPKGSSVVTPGGTEGVVDRLEPCDQTRWRTSPFKAIHVKLFDGQTKPFSPWELRPEDASTGPWAIPRTGLEPRIAEAAADALADFANRSPVAKIFKDPVEFHIYKVYQATVARPMNLLSVSSRLKTGSIRTLHQAFFELFLIRENCFAFNPSGSPLRKKANTTLKSAYTVVVQNVPVTHIPAAFNRVKNELTKFAKTTTKARNTPKISLTRDILARPNQDVKALFNAYLDGKVPSGSPSFISRSPVRAAQRPRAAGPKTMARQTSSSASWDPSMDVQPPEMMDPVLPVKVKKTGAAKKKRSVKSKLPKASQPATKRAKASNGVALFPGSFTPPPPFKNNAYPTIPAPDTPPMNSGKNRSAQGTSSGGLDGADLDLFQSLFDGGPRSPASAAARQQHDSPFKSTFGGTSGGYAPNNTNELPARNSPPKITLASRNVPIYFDNTTNMYTYMNQAGVFELLGSFSTVQEAELAYTRRFMQFTQMSYPQALGGYGAYSTNLPPGPPDPSLT